MFARTLLALALLGCTPALAGNYSFVAAPQKDLNRIYRVDRATGEVGACQYGVKEDNTGVTLCFPGGEGAVREVVELLLRAQGRWSEILRHYEIPEEAAAETTSS